MAQIVIYRIFFIGSLLLLNFHYTFSQALNDLKKAAKGGDAKAQYQLGKIYETGNKQEKQNLKKALEWYEKSALQNNDAALFALGNMYENGNGVTKNTGVAFNYYKASAQKSNSEAQFKVANFYEKGNEIKKNEQEAIKYYLLAFENGHKESFTILQRLKVDELADKKSSSYQFYKEYLQAKQEVKSTGNAEEDYQLARRYETGQGNVRKDMDRAFYYYESAANQGHPKAQLALAVMYARGIHATQNVRLAIKYYLLAASQGEPLAVSELKKYNVEKYSDPESVEFLKYKADQGDASSQYKLFEKYMAGNGVERNVNKALEYCQKAALQDHERAIMALGNLYYNGNYDISKNMESAFQWYWKGALLGNDSAKFMLGELYSTGRGVEKNENYAVRWYLLSANRGIEIAMFRLSRYDLSKFFNPNDLEYVKYKAANGNVSEQLKLGKYYYNNNNAEAIEWLSRVAKKGKEEASALLGEIYLKGKCNVAVNYQAAAKWYSEAAAKKHLEAVRQLAYIYSKNLTAAEGNNYLEKAFQQANLYLRLAREQQAAPDPSIYALIGEIYHRAGDYKNAIIHLTEFINRYDDEQNQPLQLLEAIETRADAYLQLEKYESCENDVEIALAQLESYRNHEDIRRDYAFIRGLLLYKQGKAILGKGHPYKACEIFQKAKTMGVVIEQDIHQACMN